MGWSQFRRNDLDELAADRRRRAAAKEEVRIAGVRASFGALCKFIVDAESDPYEGFTGRPTAVIPRPDGFALQVRDTVGLAEELVARLRQANCSIASNVLSEFGLLVAEPLNPARLRKIRNAAGVLVERSQHLMLVWMVSGAEDRAMEAADVAKAARRLLSETSGY